MELGEEELELGFEVSVPFISSKFLVECEGSALSIHLFISPHSDGRSIGYPSHLNSLPQCAADVFRQSY